MRQLKWIFMACVAVVAAGATTSTCLGQTSQGNRIAVVDIGLIFREYPPIKQRLTQIEETLKSSQQELMNKRRDVQISFDSLKEFKPGSPEYAAAEEKTARLESELKLEAARKHKQISEAEAKVYFDSFQQISEVVKKIAEANSIDLVLRYNSEEMKLGEEESVVRGLQKSIIYRRDNLDMTPYVLQWLNQASAQASAATAAPVR